MALPPKSDEDNPSARDSEPKKTRRTRTPVRPRKPKAEKTEKVRRSRKASSTEQPELPMMETRAEPEVRRVEPPPPVEHRSVRDDKPAEQAQPRHEARVEHFEPRRSEPRAEPAAPAPSPDIGAGQASPEPRSEAPQAPVEQSAPSTADSSAPSQPPSPPQSQPQHERGHRGDGHGHHGKHHGQQGQQGGQQGQNFGGGDRGDRGFWKHGKRKRGRHGGQWQQGGGGGGGGGGREQFPPQLPPPSTAPVIGDLPNPARFNDLAALDALANEVSSGGGEPLWLNQIYAKPLAELTSYARGLGVTIDGVPNKRQVLTEIFKFAGQNRRPLRDLGYIDQNDRGCFIAHEHVNYRLYPEDPYLPDSLVKRYGLKRGHRLEVTLQVPGEGERCPSIVRVDSVMGGAPDDISKVTPFEELIPYYPLKRILLEEPVVHPKDVLLN